MLTLLEDAQLLRKDIPNESDDDEPTPKQCISQEAMLKLNEMRVTNQLCDASIRTGDEIFNVHRAILCACSEYFR